MYLTKLLGSCVAPRTNEAQLRGSEQVFMLPLTSRSLCLASENSRFGIIYTVVGLCSVNHGIYNLEEALIPNFESLILQMKKLRPIEGKR